MFQKIRFLTDNSPVVVSNKRINKIPLEIRRLADLKFAWVNQFTALVNFLCEYLFIINRQTEKA